MSKPSKKSSREANQADAKTTAELRAGIAEFDRSLKSLTPYTPVAWLLLAISGAVFIGAAASYPGQGLAEPFSADALEAWGASSGPLVAPLDELPSDWISGTPDEVAHQLTDFESLGVTRILLWPPMHDDLEMVSLIGSEVLPAIDP